MKKTVLFSILVLVVVCSCAAQNSNNAQKIIGIWTDQFGDTWVFNANGTYGTDSGGKYVVTDSKLVTSSKGGLSLYEIFFSADGKALILILMSYYSNMREDFISQYSTEFYWCTRK